MGGCRTRSCGRAEGRSDLQVRCAVNGRMETAAEELVEKVTNRFCCSCLSSNFSLFFFYKALKTLGLVCRSPELGPNDNDT